MLIPCFFAPLLSKFVISRKHSGLKIAEELAVHSDEEIEEIVLGDDD